MKWRPTQRAHRRLCLDFAHRQLTQRVDQQGTHTYAHDKLYRLTSGTTDHTCHTASAPPIFPKSDPRPQH